MNRGASLALVVTLVVSACAPAASPTSLPSAPSASLTSPVKITVWQFGNPGTKRVDGDTWENWWAREIEEFRRINPGIEVDFASKGAEAGGTTLFIDSAVAAGSPPDIYLDVVFRQAKFASQGLLEPLDTALSDADWAALDQSGVQIVTGRDRARWGVPLFSTPPFLLGINTTVVESAGATGLLPADPDRDWTTDQFEAFLQAVTKPPDVYGTLFFAKTPSFDGTLNGYAGGFGAALYRDGDYCKNTINSPDGIRWMEWMGNLISQGLVQLGPAGLSDDDLVAAWNNEQIALAAGGDLISSAEVADRVYLVNYPHEAGLPTTPPVANAPWAITVFRQQDSNRKAAAIKFLQFVASQSMLTDIANGWGYIPVVTASAPTWAGDDTNRQFTIRMIQANGVQDMGYAINNFNEVRLAWAEARQAIWSGETPPKQALDEFVQRANALLCP